MFTRIFQRVWTLKPGKGMVGTWAPQTSSSIKGTPCKVQVDLRSIAFYSFLKRLTCSCMLETFQCEDPWWTSIWIDMATQPTPLTYPPRNKVFLPIGFPYCNTALLNPHLWGVGTFGEDGYRFTSHEIGLATFCPPVKGIYKTRHEQLRKNAAKNSHNFLPKTAFPHLWSTGKRSPICSMHGTFLYIWIDFMVFMHVNILVLLLMEETCK